MNGNTSTTGRSTWRWPAVLAIVTIGGLLMALLGNDEWWRMAAWCALALPVVVAVWNLVGRRHS